LSKTIRLVIPQWQGGNRFAYSFGSRLLEWLTPETKDETIEIPISNIQEEDIQDGIAFKKLLLDQSEATYSMLKEKNPDKVVVYGGDCSVELAPFTYLLERYQDDIAILWLDRHGDISIPGETTNYHAMVLASFLGEGDKDFSDFVKTKIDCNHLLLAGVNDTKEFDRVVGKKYNFKNIPSNDFQDSSDAVLDKLKEMNVKNIIVHFDLDVLDLASFRSQSSANPDVYMERLKLIKPGSSFNSIGRLLNDIEVEFNIVGLGITEYLPWDVMALSNLLSQLPLIKSKEKSVLPFYDLKY